MLSTVKWLAFKSLLGFSQIYYLGYHCITETRKQGGKRGKRIGGKNTYLENSFICALYIHISYTYHIDFTPHADFIPHYHIHNSFACALYIQSTLFYTTCRLHTTLSYTQFIHMCIIYTIFLFYTTCRHYHSSSLPLKPLVDADVVSNTIWESLESMSSNWHDPGTGLSVCYADVLGRGLFASWESSQWHLVEVQCEQSILHAGAIKIAWQYNHYDYRKWILFTL